MIVKLNTAPASTPSSGMGFGTILLIGLVIAAGYFGYKEYKKSQEQKQN